MDESLPFSKVHESIRFVKLGVIWIFVVFLVCCGSIQDDSTRADARLSQLSPSEIAVSAVNRPRATGNSYVYTSHWSAETVGKFFRLREPS